MAPEDPPETPAYAPAALGRVWREHRLPLLAALNARLGSLDAAEDALSEAVVRAGRVWRASLPDNPSGWLFRVALNAARDGARRRTVRTDKQPELAHLAMQPHADIATPRERLGLFRLTAHPALNPEERIALILFHLCELDAAAIGRAFLVSPSTIHKRLSRGRDKLREAEPAPHDDGAVLSAVEIIYLQSYRDPDAGAEARALAVDARQLIDALIPLLPEPAEARALSALMHFLEARRPARRDPDGRFVPFAAQDATLWSPAALSAGVRAMGEPSESPGPYAIRAQIELTRMVARREGRPRDAELLSLHDALLTLAPSPFVAIERALVLSRVEGPRAGLEALDGLDGLERLSGHAAWQLAKADCHARAGQAAAARLHFEAARRLVPGEAQKRHIAERLSRLC